MHNMILDRLPALDLHPDHRTTPTAEDWKKLKNSFEQLSLYQAFAIIRTWANAWTTSHRCHERIFRECICGCLSRPFTPASWASDVQVVTSNSTKEMTNTGESWASDVQEVTCNSSKNSNSDYSSSDSSSSSSTSSGSSSSSSKVPLRASTALSSKVNMDSLQHYLRCPILWNALEKALQKTRFQYEFVPIPSDPFERLCLSYPSRTNFTNLIVIMNSYHLLKNESQFFLLQNDQTR